MTLTLVNLKKLDVQYVASFKLVVITKLITLTNVKCSLDPLVRVRVTHLPWNSVNDPIREIDGPIRDANCKCVCHECISFLEKK